MNMFVLYLLACFFTETLILFYNRKPVVDQEIVCSRPYPIKGTKKKKAC